MASVTDTIRENPSSGISWLPIRSGYDVVRIIAAVILLVAAGLKCHQLATEPVLAKTWLDSRWLLMATVEFELFFGIWLLANILPRLTWLAALGCFSLFTCVSLYKAISGYASCGCFGTVHVNPWYTSGLDLSVVVALLVWRPLRFPSPANEKEGGGKSHWHPWQELIPRILLILCMWLVTGLPAAHAMVSYADTTLSDVGEVAGNGKIVVLKPETWPGKTFPLLPFIEDYPESFRSGKPSGERPIRAHLLEGNWLVVLYHHDCHKCQESLPKYQRLSRQAAGNPGSN